jgi:hypothetical protein
MKRIMMSILMLILTVIALAACMADVVETKVVIKNNTDFEIRWIVFDIPQSFGTYSPMHDVITAKDDALLPNQEREVTISLVKSDFGNSGGVLIGLEEEGNSDFLQTAKGEVILEKSVNHFEINNDGNNFVIKKVDK